MRKALPWLMIACLGAAGCREAVPEQTAFAPQPADAPSSVRLAIQLVAMRTPSRLAPAAPKVVEPTHDLYDTPGAKPIDAGPPETPGFKLTVPMCRRADRLGDPLAKTPECVQLIEAARAQAEACRQAFERGDDKSALSPACRQAAGFR